MLYVLSDKPFMWASLRAKRSNPVLSRTFGLLRRSAPRNDDESLRCQLSHVLDDARKIDPAISCRVECLVDFLRVLTERRRCACRFRRILRQSEILHHQRRGKTGFVVV